MSFDENSPAFRRQSIFLFFKMRYEVFRAVQELNKAFHGITFKEVDAWFARFKTGSRDLVTDVVIDDAARGMEDVPVNLKRKIMESVDFGDQKSLLQTNQCFRSILKADRRIYKELKMNLGQDCLALSLGNEVAGTELIRFLKRDEGCEKRKRDGSVTLLPGSFIDEGIKRFKKAIEKQGTKIQKMEIDAKHVVDQDKEISETFTRKIEETMAGLKESLHVEDLTIILNKKEDLHPILDKVKVGSLTALRLKSFGDELQYGLDDCQSLGAHFAHLKKLLTESVKFEFSIETLAGIGGVVAAVNQISTDEMKRFREKLLELPGYIHHFIFATFDREAIRTALEPYTVDEFGKSDGLLTAPGKKPISFSVGRCHIEFKRVQL